MISDPVGMVTDFHRHVGAAIRTTPAVDVPAAETRIQFVEEETRELREAVEAGDIVAVADALADLAYVVYGTALHFGIPFADVFAEVHRSNMTKTPAGDGKAIKGPGYQPPNVAAVLGSNHDEPSGSETVWVASTFLHIRTGDRLRMGAEEAVVTRCAVQQWHTREGGWVPTGEKRPDGSDKMERQIIPDLHWEVRAEILIKDGPILPFQQYPSDTPVEILADPERAAQLALPLITGFVGTEEVK